VLYSRNIISVPAQELLQISYNENTGDGNDVSGTMMARRSNLSKLSIRERNLLRSSNELVQILQDLSDIVFSKRDLHQHRIKYVVLTVGNSFLSSREFYVVRTFDGTIVTSADNNEEFVDVYDGGKSEHSKLFENQIFRQFAKQFLQKISTSCDQDKDSLTFDYDNFSHIKTKPNDKVYVHLFATKNVLKQPVKNSYSDETNQNTPMISDRVVIDKNPRFLSKLSSLSSTKVDSFRRRQQKRTERTNRPPPVLVFDVVDDNAKCKDEDDTGFIWIRLKSYMKRYPLLSR